MKISERIYIIKRYFQAFVYKLIFCVCSIFPIKNNKITCSSFEGGGFCCNPKYIAMELHKLETDLDIIWFVKDLNKEFPDYIHAVKDTPWNRAYHMSTAKVWVDNSRQKFGTRKRKGQYYMQTWHGQIGFKPIGHLRGESFSKIADIVSSYDARMIDAWISNSKWSSNVFRKAFYNEPIVEIGSPRTDLFYKNNKILNQMIREKYDIKEDEKILLYAPTFRGGNQKERRCVKADEFGFSVDLIKNVLLKKTKSNWSVLVRLHPQIVISKAERGDNFNGAIDVSDFDDIYELLAITDIFITDYSSAAFDAAMRYIPVMLYAKDFEDYIKDRGKLLWDVNNLPFDMARNIDELVQIILKWDNKRYRKKVEKLFETCGVKEDNMSSYRAASIILKNMKKR